MEIIAILVVSVVIISGAALTVSQARVVGRWAHERWQSHAARHLMHMVRTGKAGI